MAIVSAGYDGTVNETQFAKMLNRYSIVGASDFKATTIAGDRMVSISNGVALGPGTVDTATDIPAIQFAAAPTNTTRWDLVVLRRDWQPPGGVTSVQIVTGGTSKSIPSRNTNPGVIDDHPLYLQQVNGNLLGERIDLRCWAGPGGIAAVDTTALQYLALPGACVHIGETSWRYLPDANGVFSWAIAGSTMSYFAPLSPGSSYSNTGIIQVNGRERNVAININRTTGGLTVTSDYGNLGAVIPAGARTDTERVFYLTSTFYGNTANYPCTVFVNMQTGIVLVKIQSGSVTFSNPVSFDVNFTAVE